MVTSPLNPRQDIRRMSSTQGDERKSPFVHLHVHSMFSLFDAMGSIEKLVERAKELGYDALALTDHAALYGAVEFFETCKKNWRGN